MQISTEIASAAKIIGEEKAIECIAKAGFDAELAVQPESAINTINALLGWVPMLIAAVMLIIVFFHPIEK